MNEAWKPLPIGQLLSKSIEYSTPQPTQNYQQITIKMWGQGVVLRREVLGSEIRANRQLVARKGQFILSRIDARNGAFGLVPESLDRALVSNDFPTFDLNKSLLLPKFLEWLSRTAGFVELCKIASEGTTNRVRLKEDRFLSTEIALPPLEEQRRIVARIEELAGKVEEARELRSCVDILINAAISASLKEAFGKGIQKRKWPLSPLRKVTKIARGKFSHRPRNAPQFYGGDIPFIQIGDISSSSLYLQEFSQTLNQSGLKVSRCFPKGTIVIAITGATIGATSILGIDSCFPDSIVGIIPDKEVTSSEYVYWALEYVKKVALDQARSTTQPNINLQHLNALDIPMPNNEAQRELVNHMTSLQAKIDTLKSLQTQTATELDALLPAILDKAFKGEL